MSSTSKRLRRVFAVAGLAATALWLWAAPAAAHGVGGRLDLPVPAWQLAWAASFAVAASFVALGMFWETPKLQTAAVGRPFPGVIQHLSRIKVILLRATGLLALAVIAYAGLAGNTNPSVNIAPVAIYIVMWVGLQIVSVLFGDMYRYLNPLSTLSDGVAWLRGRVNGGTRADHRADLERGAGSHRIAVVAVFAFVWLELAYYDSANVRVLGFCVAAYCVVMLVGAALFGRGWLRDNEGFGVLFTKLSAMAPLYRSDGSLRLRAPLAGLSTLPVKPGSVAFILVVLGSTTFDGVTRSSFWLDVAAGRTGWSLTMVNTIGLVFVIFAVFVLYRGAISIMASLTGDDERELAEAFVPSLLPIAAAYTIAHYISYLLLEGQQFIALISDPFGRGWDLFGTATYRVDYTVLSTDAIGWTQTAAIAIGHVLGVAVAHDRAVERWSRPLATRSQYPMLAAMIGYTIVGLLLLLGA